MTLRMSVVAQNSYINEARDGSMMEVPSHRICSSLGRSTVRIGKGGSVSKLLLAMAFDGQALDDAGSALR